MNVKSSHTYKMAHPPFATATLEEQIRGVFTASFAAPNERIRWSAAEGRAILTPGVVRNATVLHKLLDPAVLPRQSAAFQRAFVATLRGALDGRPENVARMLHLSDRDVDRDVFLQRCVSCAIDDALESSVAADMAALVGTLCSVTASPAVLRHLFSLMRSASAQRINSLLAIAEATLLRHPSYHKLPRAFFSLSGDAACALGIRHNPTPPVLALAPGAAVSSSSHAGSSTAASASSVAAVADIPTWPFAREYMFWAWIRLSPVAPEELGQQRAGWGGVDGRAYLLRLLTVEGYGIEIYVDSFAKLTVEVRPTSSSIVIVLK